MDLTRALLFWIALLLLLLAALRFAPQDGKHASERCEEAGGQFITTPRGPECVVGR